MARSEEGVARLVEFAEALQAPVFDEGGNMPSRHPLNQLGMDAHCCRNADVILGLELSDFWGTLNSVRDQQQRSVTSLIRPGTKLISIATGEHLRHRATTRILSTTFRGSIWRWPLIPKPHCAASYRGRPETHRR